MDMQGPGDSPSVLAAALADLRSARPTESATRVQWAAWYLRQANILDEIARVDSSHTASARRAAEAARECARELLEGDRD
ncbi:AMED_5909 family protein [Actinocrispum wychmicini]|uniref:Uncharacterized protein n=1 Tax=Actinocrispum wychmicini TaxID=1213861 RepID=A0A4R2JQH6_9PSEU|nr:AMED_5909 family protein [Actinocrispum wychmicini]TCO59446.1 hypothetical protein EV192_104288 [Actinocrispum wychmicini]